MKRIHDSLRQAFTRHRLVFWYDPSGEWAEAAAAYDDPAVQVRTVDRNEFGIKVRIVRDPNPDARFLLYLPSYRPADADNWLLDLLLQGHEFKADKASLVLQELGLGQELRFLVDAHSPYFVSTKHVQSLKSKIEEDDDARKIRFKMMTVLASTSAPDLDALLLHFLGLGVPVAGGQATLHDPVAASLDSASLTPEFWRMVGARFGYLTTEPSLRDFAVSLFRAANPLDRKASLHANAKVFLQRWQDSQTHGPTFRLWSEHMQQELQILPSVEALDAYRNLGDADTFPCFDQATLHGLCRDFDRGAPAAELRAVIEKRRSSFWWTDHEHGYAALDQALEIRELLASAELSVDSVAIGIRRYTASWWRIDMAYRRCIWHLLRYNQVQLMEQIRGWVGKTYVNNYLLPLTDRWGDQVSRLGAWSSEDYPSQRRFYDIYVKPFLARDQKVFVIISDGLRFEAAAEFAQRLRAANRWTAELEVMLGVLPSYTQLGMAALLPGRQLAVDATAATVAVDGRSATGTANRAQILSQACAGRATAVQAEEFLNLNTKTDGRTLMRDHDVIYIYHNTIDKTGDESGTEHKTLDAVERTFEELEQIIRKVANINGSNMLLTADHGFLFQQDPVADGDMTALPAAEGITYRTRRFAIGRGIASNPTVKVFNAADLKLDGDWSVAFPLSLGRFPLQGSGKRYVHGGTSLQEVVIPVVRIHKARADDVERVEVDLLQVPAKITTGQVAFSIYQDRPTADKVLGRTLRVGVFAKDGTVLSELKVRTFDAGDPEDRNREASMLLVLSTAADAFNNQDVELRLEELVAGTSQYVTYKAQTLRLHKPFGSDFDDF